jgi:hypothetical protein
MVPKEGIFFSEGGGEALLATPGITKNANPISSVTLHYVLLSETLNQETAY